jgi:hypothetical protein
MAILQTSPERVVIGIAAMIRFAVKVSGSPDVLEFRLRHRRFPIRERALRTPGQEKTGKK